MSKNITAASNVIPFDFGKKQVRAMLINDQPWFVAKDVIIALGYAGSSNPARVVGHVPDEWKGVNPIHTHGGIQRLLMLSEQGLYFFICRSDKEQALPFQKWVAGDVLPTIRKHGRYEDNNNHMATLMDELIGMSELSVIKGLIRDKAKAVPAEKRQSFAMTMHSRLHTRFNVPRTELIPAGQFESACNFIAAYAIEGEWLPREEKPNQQLYIHYPVSRWLKENPIFARQQEPNGPGSLLISAMMLYGLGSSSPTQELLDELEAAGYNVEACRIEQQAMKYHLERMSNDISEIQRKCFVGAQAGLRFRVGQEVAA